jgi:hypothetical protein
MRKTPQNLLQGQAGVYQVASQLCLRGFNPCFPAVDIGADLVVDGGIRIQVKAANLCKRGGYTAGAYWFKLGKMTIRNRKQTWVQVNFSDFCDFAVFWGIDHNRFWIVPAADLDGHQLVVVGPDLGYRSLPMETIESMMAGGSRQQDVADSLGVSQMTISRRLRGQYVTPARPLCERVRRLEGRWDLIGEYLESLRQANQIVVDKLVSMEES